MNEEETDRDDEVYSEALEKFIDGIDGLLGAGATPEDVRSEFAALMRGRS